MKTSMCLLASAMLFAGCNPLRHQEVLIDRGLPHQVAEDIQVPLLLRQPDGTFITEWATIYRGYWIASPEALATPPALSDLGTQP